MPEVACKLLKDPVDAFNTDVFVVVDCIVVTIPEMACMFEALKTDTFPVLD